MYLSSRREVIWRLYVHIIKEVICPYNVPDIMSDVLSDAVLRTVQRQWACSIANVNLYLFSKQSLQIAFCTQGNSDQQRDNRSALLSGTMIQGG